jgi:cell division protein FtsB
MYKVLILILVTIYFSYHFVVSTVGDSSINKLQCKLEASEKRLLTLQKQRFVLESKLTGLRSGNPDEDFLDEVARREMGLAEPDEIVVIINKKQPSLSYN